MKAIHICRLATGLLAVILFTACSKKLDLAPEGTLTEKAALQDSANALSLLAGAYLNLWTASTGDAYALGDLTTGVSQSAVNLYATGGIDPKNTTLASFWNNNYATINLANVLIVNLPQTAQFNATLQQQYIGEAKFIRAFSYFNLLILFGDGALQGKMDNMGVPLRLQPFSGYDGSQNIPRSSNAQVYNRIIQDLDDAAAALPAGYSNDLSQRTRATQGSAQALAARVSLYMNSYDKCIAYCNAVLGDSHFSLQGSVTDVFPNNSSGNKPYPFNPEIIFAFPASYNNDPTQYAENGIYYYYGFIWPGNDFAATYAADDLRRTSMMMPNSFTSNLTTIKFSDPNDRDNLVMLRLAETILNEAEALAYKNGVNQASIDLLNKIHQRAFPAGSAPAPYTMASFADQQALIGQILQERQWELAFEGQDRFDKIRTGGQPIPTLPQNKYAFPIPQTDIDLTSGLIKQNPGY
jgi:hypothetical protein